MLAELVALKKTNIFLYLVNNAASFTNFFILQMTRLKSQNEITYIHNSLLVMIFLAGFEPHDIMFPKRML
jgi:hypothetical protein